MIQTSFRRLLTWGLTSFAMVTLLVPFGCTSAPKTNLPIPWTSPAQFDAVYREDYRVFFQTEAEGEDKVLVGYVYRQVSGNDELHWVLDRERQPVGFLLENELAFRLVDEEDETGRSIKAHRELGNFGLEGGVHRVLDLQLEGEVELERTVTRGKLPRRGDDGSDNAVY